jgi:hypothetical protein
MRAILPSSSLRRSVSWLVCLALLLPLAQFAATWHGFSHAWQDASGNEDDRQVSHGARCDVCLTAAAVSGGALLSTHPSLPVPTVHHGRPEVAAGSIWLASATPAYRSRAPPLAPR